eukprot:m.73223 g.73223  ORF g.73223 m.73223 type:complete len:359 (-) comp24538_c0_seq1:33-1109(-)
MGKIKTKRGRMSAKASTHSAPGTGLEQRKGKSPLKELDDVWHPDSLKLTPLDLTEQEILSNPSLMLKPSSVSGPIGSGNIDSYVVTTGPAIAPILPKISLDVDNSDMDDDEKEDGDAAERPKLLSKRQHQITTEATKNGRRLMRREQFIQKLQGLHKSKRKHQVIATKKANPTALVGDLTGLQSELEAIGGGRKNTNTAVPDGRAKKTLVDMKTADKKVTQRVTSKRGRQHTLMMEANNFKNVLANPQFKINPGATVKTHLKNSISADQRVIEALGISTGVPRKAATLMKKTKANSAKAKKVNFKMAVGATTKSGVGVSATLGTKMRRMGKIGKKGRLTMSMKNPKARKALKRNVPAK